MNEFELNDVPENLMIKYLLGKKQINPEELEKKVGSWTSGLAKGLDSVINGRPNEPAIMSALGELKDLHSVCPYEKVREELAQVYYYNRLPKARMEAGKELGYSGIRIFFHEHPKMKTATSYVMIIIAYVIKKMM